MLYPYEPPVGESWYDFNVWFVNDNGVTMVKIGVLAGV